MTAEIAILNKEAVALAADSAVTMSQGRGEKIFPSALKLFALSKFAPVGIMVYGNAQFMGVPWETIIKDYRRYLNKRRKYGLIEYANDLFKFLNNHKDLANIEKQKKYFAETLHGYFISVIIKAIDDEVENTINNGTALGEKEVNNIITKIISYYYELLCSKKYIASLKGINSKRFHIHYDKLSDEIIKRVFEKLPISRSNYNKLLNIARLLFLKDIFHENCPGIAIAGFGENEIFPSLVVYKIEGIVLNRIKYKQVIYRTISDNESATIIPLAQSEMVHTFMGGIDPIYVELIHKWLIDIFEGYNEILINEIKIKYGNTDKLKKKINRLSPKLIGNFGINIEKYRKEKFIYPIMDVVASLPKNELATMAETLVNLTSFKRKVTMASETVGGPIDVAVISKGDGFIWIKRKHYFSPELNHHFFDNYYEGKKNE